MNTDLLFGTLFVLCIILMILDYEIQEREIENLRQDMGKLRLETEKLRQYNLDLKPLNHTLQDHGIEKQCAEWYIDKALRYNLTCKMFYSCSSVWDLEDNCAGYNIDHQISDVKHCWPRPSHIANYTILEHDVKGNCKTQKLVLTQWS